EAGRALRLAVAGHGELDGAGVLVPVPVLGVGVRLQAVAAHVKPHRRVEGGSVFGRGEVATGETPITDGFGDAADELAHAGFALRGADLAMQIFAGDD